MDATSFRRFPFGQFSCHPFWVFLWLYCHFQGCLDLSSPRLVFRRVLLDGAVETVPLMVGHVADVPAGVGGLLSRSPMFCPVSTRKTLLSSFLHKHQRFSAQVVDPRTQENISLAKQQLTNPLLSQLLGSLCFTWPDCPEMSQHTPALARVKPEPHSAAGAQPAGAEPPAAAGAHDWQQHL